MPRDIQYLTVQDHLWINLQVTGHQQQFKFADLEEAVYLQYAYQTSNNVIAQAARYGAKFASKSPFARGNEATAFVGLVSFLRLNGFNVELSDAKGADFMASLATGGEDAVRKAVRHDHHAHDESVEDVAKAVIEAYPKTISKLNKQAVA
ncbi:MAG: hypothetical protein JNK63_05210 [Chthonomonas sp.]|nr:hypothetical protein [Chthonomonas sp.]